MGAFVSAVDVGAELAFEVPDKLEDSATHCLALDEAEPDLDQVHHEPCVAVAGTVSRGCWLSQSRTLCPSPSSVSTCLPVLVDGVAVSPFDRAQEGKDLLVAVLGLERRGHPFGGDLECGEQGRTSARSR